jgi:hypothetical protein
MLHTLRAALCAVAFGALAFGSTAVPVRADVTGVVRGSLTGADHKPLPGVTVTLAGESRQTTVTGTDGRFVFARVPFGRYTISAPTAGGSASAFVEVASDAVVTVTLAPLSTIGNTVASETGVQGTPVSENTISGSELAALPADTSLDRIVETLPGIVRFSFDEPVAHGFHGLTYELDGAPFPQSTSSNFSQLIDPRNASAIEVFTGAFPAEFGGARMGALVNIFSGNERSLGDGGSLTFSGGNLGTAGVRLVQHVGLGSQAELTVAIDDDRSNRGLDSPSEDAVHDNAGTGNAYLHLTDTLANRNFLTVDVSSQTATYQIPITTTFDPNQPVVSPLSTDDVQREIEQFATFSFTHTSADGLGYVRVVPWLRYERIQYLGDLANDVLANAYEGPGMPDPDGFQNGLQQDRVAAYAGLSASAYRAGAHHALTFGTDLDAESFRGNEYIACGLVQTPTDSNGCLVPSFVDNTAQRGTNVAFYAEDKWTPNAGTALTYGLRYDHSTGYVDGGQLSPRIELDQQLGTSTVAHVYFGRLYAAPGLEDTRRDAVLTGTAAGFDPTALPVYDLQPERDSYLEVGFSHTFAPGVRAYVNAFDRNVTDVLDTTNLLNSPEFIVYNSTIGIDRGVEARLDVHRALLDAGLSLTLQHSVAGGISGSTFLNGPPGSANDVTLFPEDHDQTWTGNAHVTRSFGRGALSYATLETEYGTGFPVDFGTAGTGRLPAHFIIDAAFGRRAPAHGIGYQVDIENLLDHRYLIKVENGFNTTQWNAPRGITFRLTQAW